MSRETVLAARSTATSGSAAFPSNYFLLVKDTLVLSFGSSAESVGEKGA